MNSSPPLPTAPNPVGEDAGARSRLGVLGTPIWPRTVRRMLGSILLPWVWARMGGGRIEAFVASTALPASIGGLVRTVVRRTRLWPSERMDVAHELAAHFADGLHAGRGEADLVRDFGDPEAAADLIRRAKVRNRPLWWKSCRWTVRVAGVMTVLLLVTYAWLAGRYYLGRPTIRHNYAGEMNAGTLATPVEQRAWPLYVRAIREMGPNPTLNYKDSDWPTRPEEPDWNAAATWVDGHAEVMSTVRAATKAKTLGYMLSGNADVEYMRALEVRTPAYKFDETLERPKENPLLLGVLLPYLGEMRSQARLLRFDARLAMQRGDAGRFVEDVECVLGMVEQCASQGTTIDKLVAIAIGELGANVAMEGMGREGFLRDEDLTHIGHRFAMVAGGRISMDSTFERMTFEDMLQRFYTDNGNGDGHLVAAQIEDTYRDFGVVNPLAKPLGRTIRPLQTATARSRAEVQVLVDKYVAAIRRNDSLPLWRQGQRSRGAELMELCVALERVFPIEALMGQPEDGSFLRQFAARDTFEARRAAVMAACALERSKRVHGAYPATLEALVPQMLPSVPVDPFDGKAMRYRVVGEGAAARPLLWSVGVDQIDDGGKPPAQEKDRDLARGASKLAHFGPGFVPTAVQAREMAQARGDWVLYPLPGAQK